LAATDEKDLSASQHQKKTDSRLSGPHGLPGGAQGAQTQAGKGAKTPDHNDPSEAARLEGRRGALSFSCTDKLKSSWEFAQVQRRGVRWQTDHFVVYALRVATSQRPRIGITVSRRIGNAVARNRIKRRVRECFRLGLREMLPLGANLVVIARPGAGEIDTPTIKAELETASLRLINKLRER
jgi:ribonuclease P protein component